ncbi:MAG: phosphoribosylanthranilate isomerase [Candidatus Omnitrophota bacterium]
MVKVKICGLTNLEDAKTAYDCGADLLGFVFIKGTPRTVKDDRFVRDACKFGEDEPKTPHFVGLFKNEDPKKIAKIVSRCGLNYVQLQGEESPGYCRRLREMLAPGAGIIKAFRVGHEILRVAGKYIPGDYSADYLVFDTYDPELAGGTGKGFDRKILAAVKENIDKPFFVAGGLTPANVAALIREVQPYGVDVSSGIERVPGKKDEKLLKEFIYNAKKA